MIVTASAPGKVILIGEHAVLYGENKAVAAAINDMRTVVEVKETCDGLVTLTVPEQVYAQRTMHCVRRGVEGGTECSSFAGESAVNSQRVCLHVLDKCNTDERPISIAVTVTSTIPIGAGLGSSAAYCAALTTACYTYFHPTVTLNDAHTMRTIQDIAHSAESLLHGGTSSGLDVAISLHGNVIVYGQGSMQRRNFNTACNPTRLLLVDTGVQRSAGRIVRLVRETREKRPSSVDRITASLGRLSAQLASLVLTEEGKEYKEVYDELTSICRKSNELLASLHVEVFHEKAEIVCRVLRDAHGLAGKITGAGGGGCVMAFLPGDVNEACLLSALATDLPFAHSSVVTLGGVGVQLIDNQSAIN